MFSLHAGIAFWRVTVIKEHSLEVQPIEMPTWGPFLNLAGIGLLVIETFITLLYRKVSLRTKPAHQTSDWLLEDSFAPLVAFTGGAREQKVSHEKRR